MDEQSCDNFAENLERDPNPNFLRYTLFALEKSNIKNNLLFKEIRLRMEQKYNLPFFDPWTKMDEPSTDAS